MFGEFKVFLTKSNALALAIGVIIGVALGAVVNSLVNDIIMPPIGYAPRGRRLRRAQDRAQGGSRQRPRHRDRDPLGRVHPACRSSSSIVAFVVFSIGRAVIQEAPAAPVEPTDEVKLLTEIRDSLQKG